MTISHHHPVDVIVINAIVQDLVYTPWQTTGKGLYNILYLDCLMEECAVIMRSRVIILIVSN